MEHKTQDIQSVLQQISDVLLINGGFLSNPGLYSGEMGLVLFFAHYARFTQNDLYMEYAYGLTEKIQTGISRNTPINYKQGLAGIGSAIEYLVQNGFFEADTDDVLEDFDKRIFFSYNLLYLPVDEIMDIGYYAAWRLSGNSAKKDMIRQTILLQLEKIMYAHSVNPPKFPLIRKAIPVGFEKKTYAHCLEIIANNKFWGNDMGLQTGLAGWGLALLGEHINSPLHYRDDSWILLLPDKSQ